MSDGPTSSYFAQLCPPRLLRASLAPRQCSCRLGCYVSPGWHVVVPTTWLIRPSIGSTYLSIISWRDASMLINSIELYPCIFNDRPYLFRRWLCNDLDGHDVWCIYTENMHNFRLNIISRISKFKRLYSRGQFGETYGLQMRTPDNMY